MGPESADSIKHPLRNRTTAPVPNGPAPYRAEYTPHKFEYLLLSICNTNGWELRLAAGEGCPSEWRFRNGRRRQPELRAKSGAVRGGWLVDAGIGWDGMFVAPHGGFWN